MYICRVTACLSTDRRVFAHRARHYLLSLACHPSHYANTSTFDSTTPRDPTLSRPCRASLKKLARELHVVPFSSLDPSWLACRESGIRATPRETRKKGEKKARNPPVADKFPRWKVDLAREQRESPLRGVSRSVRTHEFHERERRLQSANIWQLSAAYRLVISRTCIGTYICVYVYMERYWREGRRGRRGKVRGKGEKDAALQQKGVGRRGGTR